MHLAKRYKRLSKRLYAATLLLGVLMIACSTVRGEDWLEAALAGGDSADAGDDASPIMRHVVFGLSLLSAALLIAERFFNPMRRSRLLRASASSLESLIWRFRTRVGEFAVRGRRES